MAEQIIQTLGFDAQGAIGTIDALNQSLATLSTRLSAVAGSAKAFNAAKVGRTFKTLAASNPGQNLNQAAQAANNLGTSLNSVGAQGGAALNNLNKRTQSLTLSWQTLSRIIVAQTLIRGINAFTGAIGNAVRETRELQKRISEIQTIAGGRLGLDADVLEGLQATAETFGLDILDVAEAKYQELSNQVRGSAESTEFFDTASKLAIATNSDLADSVNLLSSVLNAFDEDASKSEEVAGVLFKTIEQGRVRASELANSFGRVLPLAGALGIEFNEVAASIVKITQGGARADQALTQFLGIINKLSKPTPALAEAFEELGVATAREGVRRSGGFLQFLQRLKAEAGDDQELVGFFNNVRAIQGVLSLLGGDATRTEEVFEKLGLTAEQSGEAIDAAFETAADNDARELDRQLQELGGTFRELAATLIPLLTSSLSFLNDVLNSIKDNPVISGVILGVGAGAIISFATAASGAIPIVVGLGKALVGLAVATGPVGIAFVAITASIAGLTLALREQNDVVDRTLTERFTKILEDREEAFKRIKKEVRETSQAFEDGAQDVQNFLNQFTDLERTANQQLQLFDARQVSDVSGALDALLQSRSAISKQISDAITKADKEIEKSGERQADLRGKKDDFLLNRQLKNLNDLQKSFKQVEASRTQALSARDLIQGSTDLSDFDQAADILDRRLKLAQDALKAAESSGNRSAIVKAEQEVVTALNDQINLETRRSQIIEQRRQAAEQAAAEDKAALDLLKNTVTELEKNLSILEDGQILNPEALARAESEVQRLLSSIRGQGLEGEVFDITQFLGLEDLAGRFKTRLDEATRSISESRQQIPNEVEKIFEEINSVIPDDVLQIAIDLELTEGGPNQLRAFSEAIANAADEVGKLESSQEKLAQASQITQDNVRGFVDVFRGAEGTPQLLTDVVKAVLAISQNANATTADLERLFGFLDRQAGNITNQIDLGPGSDEQIRKRAIEQLQQLIAARQREQEVAAQTAPDQARLQALQGFLQAAQSVQNTNQAAIELLGTIDERTGQVSQTTLKAVQTTQELPDAWQATTQATNAAKQAVDDYTAAVNAAAAAAARVPPTPGVGSMFGGSRGALFRAAGGFARGTDTIPAMLSPGEFVVNAASSRQFASELNAINAGVKPLMRQEGGSVVNNSVNVGDINVNGTANPDDTARKVVSQLRREFRRGTASRIGST